MKRTFLLVFSFIFLLFCTSVSAQDDNYDIGVGISDVTGQIAETNFFGFGNVFFKNAGIRDRQYARAYIIQEPNERPVVFVSIDKGATFQSVSAAVVKKLKSLYGDLYLDENVVISATHTHVSPGGYSFYQLYDLSVGLLGGFYKTNFDILVDGIVEAIKSAHENIAPGRIYYNTGNLYNASINRSAVAYNLNKDKDQYDLDIDPEMTVLKFVQGSEEVGMLSFFGVHPTSLSQKFELCSGDNKGYAALKFERLKKSTYGKGDKTFVAAFANTNAGDMSPNLNLPDDLRSDSTGPGETDEESADIIGTRQFDKALELYNTATEQLFGPVKAVSRYTDMSKVEVEAQFTNGEIEHTCDAALGVSFRAGAEDARSGIGREGQARTNPLEGSDFHRCHMEKVVDPLFILGKDQDKPRSQKILPTSILKIGQLGLLAGPAEFTIMAGRRIKSTVLEYGDVIGLDHVIVVGYSDAYAGYVTTREEYSSQQYEGASTHFGPWTLAAYRQTYDRLAQKLVDPASDPWNEVEPIVPDLSPLSNDQTVKIFFDNVPLTKEFGDIYKQADISYATGDQVTVSFWGAHPNNDPKTNETYLEVQKLTDNGWQTVYTDRDTNTKLAWKRIGIADSRITIDWKITPEVEAGFYRIVHYGNWKSGWTGAISEYTGTTDQFYVNGDFGAEGLSTRSNLEASDLTDLVSKISISPNPTHEEVNLFNSSDSDLSYEIVDVLGTVVQSGKLLNNSTSSLNIDGARGVYFVKFIDAKGSSFQTSIVKQ